MKKKLFFSPVLIVLAIVTLVLLSCQSNVSDKSGLYEKIANDPVYKAYHEGKLRMQEHVLNNDFDSEAIEKTLLSVQDKNYLPCEIPLAFMENIKGGVIFLKEICTLSELGNKLNDKFQFRSLTTEDQRAIRQLADVVFSEEAVLLRKKAMAKFEISEK